MGIYIIRKIENSKYEVDLCFTIKNAARFITFLFQLFRFALFTKQKKKFIRQNSLSLFILPQTMRNNFASSLFQIIQHEAEYTSAPYKCIINFCSLGSFLHHLLLLMEKKILWGKVFLLLVLVFWRWGQWRR